MVEAIVATLGFDADFALRRLSRGAPKRALFLALKVDEASWARVYSAYNLVQMFCSYSKVDCVLEPIGTSRPVAEVYSILRREAEKNESLELFLTGGPRILVISALVAALLLPQRYARKIKTVVEGEGFEASIEVNIGVLQKLLSLGEPERRILVALLEHERGLTAPKIASVAGVPRTSTYRKLDLLKSLSLVEEEGGRYRLAENVRIFLRVIPLGDTIGNGETEYK